MAQYYTLEEAAQKLGMPVDEFKRRLREEWTKIRPLRDGSTLRIRASDVDELARQQGLGSEPELTLADSGDELVPLPEKESVSPPLLTDEPLPLNFEEDTGPAPSLPSVSRKTKPDEDAPLIIDDGPIRFADDDQIVLLDDSAAGPKKGSDSDVRLEKADGPRGGSTGSDSEIIITEEIDLGVLPSSGDSGTKLSGSGKLTSSSSGKLGKASKKSTASEVTQAEDAPADNDSSEFELNLSTESSSEFELSLTDESSGEISLGDIAVSPSPGPTSGINLGNPADAGVSLEGKSGGARSGAGKSGGKAAKAPSPNTESDEDIDFELSLDGPSSGGKAKSGAKAEADSDSEFELSLDDSSEISISLDAETTSLSADEPKGDIFETDFEIPALDDDSASEAIAIEEADTDLESSDFDLAIDEGDVSVEDESGSEAVVLDDEDMPPKKKKKRPVVADDEELVVSESADDDHIGAALTGVSVEDEEEPEVRTVLVGSAPWGVLPAILLLPCVMVMFVAGLMGYELIRTMWGYQQGTKPATLVVDKVAEALDMKPKE